MKGGASTGSGVSDENVSGEASRRQRRTPDRRRGSGAETRSNLIRSTRVLAENKLIADITVDDITRGANVSRAAFYMYFQSKFDICQEIARAAQAGFLANVREFDRGPDVNATIEHGIDHYITLFRGDRPGLRLMYELSYLEDSIREVVHEMRDQIFEFWEDRLREAIRKKEYRPFDVPVMTRLLVDTLDTYCVRTMRTEEYDKTGIDDATAARLIAKIWQRTLAG